jgi:hypothetical protein
MPAGVTHLLRATRETWHWEPVKAPTGNGQKHPLGHAADAGLHAAGDVLAVSIDVAGVAGVRDRSLLEDRGLAVVAPDVLQGLDDLAFGGVDASGAEQAGHEVLALAGRC